MNEINNLKELWTLSETASDLGINKGYLSRKFKDLDIPFSQDGQYKYYSVYDKKFRNAIVDIKNKNAASNLLYIFKKTKAKKIEETKKPENNNEALALPSYSTSKTTLDDLKIIEAQIKIEKLKGDLINKKSIESGLNTFTKKIFSIFNEIEDDPSKKSDFYKRIRNELEFLNLNAGFEIEL